MAGAADLDGCAHGQFGRIDDGFPFFKDGCFRQGRVPGAFAVAGFAGDAGLDKCFFFHIKAGGVTSTAFERPGSLVPVGLVVVDPAVGLGVILNR